MEEEEEEEIGFGNKKEGKRWMFEYKRPGRFRLFYTQFYVSTAKGRCGQPGLTRARIGRLSRIVPGVRAQPST